MHPYPVRSATSWSSICRRVHATSSLKPRPLNSSLKFKSFPGFDDRSFSYRPCDDEPFKSKLRCTGKPCCVAAIITKKKGSLSKDSPFNRYSPKKGDNNVSGSDSNRLIRLGIIRINASASLRMAVFRKNLLSCDRKKNEPPWELLLKAIRWASTWQIDL